MDSIIDKLATSLGRRDEVPNQELAKEIVDTDNIEAVNELVELLQNHKDKNIQNDCIKTIYEVGMKKPELISGYLKEFTALLNHKNNRLVWGAMIALDTITISNGDEIMQVLPGILDVADKGSVITKDNAVGILIKLSSLEKHIDNALPLLLEQLRLCPIKQLPMYAERALECIVNIQNQDFINLLSERITECEKESQRKRLEKVIKKANTK